MARKSYTTQYKLQIIKTLRENAENISKTARKAGISNKMLREWKNKEDVYLSLTSKMTTTRIGSGRTAFSPELEIQLNEWLTNERRVNKRIIS